jgi:hypothetical protein
MARSSGAPRYSMRSFHSRIDHANRALGLHRAQHKTNMGRLQTLQVIAAGGRRGSPTAASGTKQPTESRPVTQSARKKTASHKSAIPEKAGKRELMVPRGDKRYVRRDSKGRIAKSVEVGRSLSADSRRKAKTIATRGQGDRGDECR